MVSIYINNNSFHGILQSELANFNRLDFINITSNKFTGDIPTWFSFLTEIQHFHLAFNNFTSIIQLIIYNASKFESLVLGFIREIPNKIGNLQKLTWLSLGPNQLTVFLPLIVFNISLLHYLVLMKNHLFETFLSIYAQISYSLLYFHFLTMNLMVKFLWGIDKCSKVQYLSLSFDKFSGLINMI